MPATIACPKCQTKYKLPDSALGKPIKCQKCGGSFRTQAPKPNQAHAAASPSPSGKAEPSAQELAQYGIEGPLKRQADIFSSGPAPQRGNPLGNFVLQDPGFADLEKARKEAREEEGGSDGMESILANPYAKISRGKMGGRKSNVPDVDLKPYGVARIGMWMVFVSWVILLSCMSLMYIFSWLVRLEFVRNIVASIGPGVFLTLSTILLGLMSLSLGIVFIGQIICIFSPNKDEKIFAGLSVGSLVAAVILPIVGIFIGALGASVSGDGAAGDAAKEVVGLMMMVIMFASYVLALSNMFCFIIYFRKVGNNIRSKELKESAKLAMIAWITAIVAAIVSATAFFILFAIFREQPEWFPLVINLISLVNVILGFAVMVTLVGMAKTALEKTRPS